MKEKYISAISLLCFVWVGPSCSSLPEGAAEQKQKKWYVVHNSRCASFEAGAWAVIKPSTMANAFFENGIDVATPGDALYWFGRCVDQPIAVSSLPLPASFPDNSATPRSNLKSFEDLFVLVSECFSIELLPTLHGIARANQMVQGGGPQGRGPNGYVFLESPVIRLVAPTGAAHRHSELIKFGAWWHSMALQAAQVPPVFSPEPAPAAIDKARFPSEDYAPQALAELCTAIGENAEYAGVFLLHKSAPLCGKSTALKWTLHVDASYEELLSLFR